MSSQGSPFTSQPSLLPQTAIGSSSSPNYSSLSPWSSGLCNCFSDEETCWWGTWCLCLLSGRNIFTFPVGSRSVHSGISTAFFVFLILTIIFIAIRSPFFLISFLLFLLSAIFYIIFTGNLRTLIRSRYSIGGNAFDDYCMHLFCISCSTCQESRQAKALKLPEVDFISGQNLSELQPIQMGSTPMGDGSAAVGSSLPDEERIKNMTRISPASVIILQLVSLFLVTLILSLAFTNPLGIVTLLLLFVQPAAILYFVYWRQRRNYAQLDYVIKIFVVGFFLSTIQSIVFEEILQTILGIVFVIAFSILAPSSFIAPSAASLGATAGITVTGVGAAGVGAAGVGAAGGISYGAKLLAATVKIFARTRPILRPAMYNGEQIQLIANWVLPLSTMLFGNQQFELSAESISSGLLGQDTSSNDDGVILVDIPRERLATYFILVAIALFMMAFVIAAGVEETMKHFALRCCRLPAELRDPQTVLVYLLTAALGFATSENMEYVFGQSLSMHGTGLFYSEIFVLALRICMPIHLICSVLQAAKLSEVVTGATQSHLFMILLPAIFLHGSFDYFLFMVEAIQVLFKVQSLAFDVITFIVPFLITIGGIAWAYYSFNNVDRHFRNQWRPISQALDEENDVHTILL